MTVIMVTTKCNFACAHCCHGCCPGKGVHMPYHTFKKALKHIDGSVTLSGGEPTLHPRFREMLIEAIAAADDDLGVLVVTNGSVKKNALLLAKLAKRGVIAADLSLDDGFHDEFRHMVSEEVVQAFKPDRKGTFYSERDSHHGLQGYRTVNRICNRGSAEENEVSTVDDCACEDVTIWPDGRITPCGCADSPTIGNVDKGFEMPEEFESGSCWRKQPELFEPGRCTDKKAS